MPAFQVREEVLNVVLAELLSARGLLSVPESIRRSVDARGRRLPDVTVADLQGVRIVIEGRIGETRAVQDSLYADARARVEEGVSPICLAVLYPASLRHVGSLAQVRDSLERAPLTVRVISEGDEGDWAPLTVDDLTAVLRRSYEVLVSEDVVSRAVEELDAALDRAAEAIAGTRASPARLRALLGIPEETPARGRNGEDGR